MSVTGGPDAEDPYSRTPLIGEGAAPWAATKSFRFGIPPANTLEFSGDPHNPDLYQEAIAKLVALGGKPVEIDLAPFLAIAQLLYKGPWVAERYAAIASFVQVHA